MPQWPKISIVTPSRNQAAYLETCIRSVQTQHYPNLEHILVDGKSDDGTLKILKKYPHLKWISEPDRGQGDALNKGIRLATGELFGWMNADDYYLPDVFWKVAEAYLNFTEADIFYGDALWHHKLMNRSILYRAPETLNSKKIATTERCILWNQSSFIKMDRVKELQPPFDLRDEYALDLGFFLRLSRACRFKKIGGTFSTIVFHPGVKSSVGFDVFFAERIRQLKEFCASGQQPSQGWLLRLYASLIFGLPRRVWLFIEEAIRGKQSVKNLFESLRRLLFALKGSHAVRDRSRV